MALTMSQVAARCFHPFRKLILRPRTSLWTDHVASCLGSLIDATSLDAADECLGQQITIVAESPLLLRCAAANAAVYKWRNA